MFYSTHVCVCVSFLCFVRVLRDGETTERDGVCVPEERSGGLCIFGRVACSVSALSVSGPSRPTACVLCVCSVWRSETGEK